MGEFEESGLSEKFEDGAADSDWESAAAAETLAIARMIREDPTAARLKYPSVELLAAAMVPGLAANYHVFDALRDTKSKVLLISPSDLKRALERRKMEAQRERQREAQAQEDEAKDREGAERNMDAADRIKAVCGCVPLDERELIFGNPEEGGGIMLVRGYDMTWDRVFTRHGQIVSSEQMVDDILLTASQIGLLKPRSSWGSQRMVERAIGEWSELRRKQREQDIITRINVLTPDRNAVMIRAEFIEVCDKFFADEPELAAAMMLEFIWQVKRRLLGLDIGHPIFFSVFGPQDAGKSYLVRDLLCGPVRVLVLETNPGDLLDTRQIDMLMYPICFFDEMAWTERATATALKNFMSATTPARRPMRTNMAEKVRNRTVLIATANGSLANLIYDPSGMRRFAEKRCRMPEEIAPFHDRISGFDWTGLWQSVDALAANPLSAFKDRVKAIQEEMRTPDPVEQWLAEFEFDAADVDGNRDIHRRDNHSVSWFATPLFFRFQAWAERNTGTKGYGKIRFWRQVKQLCDDGRAPCWRYHGLGHKCVFQWMSNVVHMHRNKDI